jgi:hypothetical protein
VKTSNLATEQLYAVCQGTNKLTSFKYSFVYIYLQIEKKRTYIYEETARYNTVLKISIKINAMGCSRMEN